MSNFNNEVCEFNSTKVTEGFAAQNGWGQVFHMSDCGSGYVRSYCCGGDGPCSGCGKWGLSDGMIDAVHSRDYNWTRDEAAVAAGGSYQ